MQGESPHFAECEVVNSQGEDTHFAEGRQVSAKARAKSATEAA